MHGIRMWRRGRHPVHGLPFEAVVPNQLGDEWRAMALARRFGSMRKVLQRDLLMLGIGQAGLCVERVPDGTRKVLWFYNWSTLGDSVMDLSARFSIPAAIRLDLCIAAPLAELYRSDLRFGRVFEHLADCDRDYDFVLVHALSTESLIGKRRHLRRVPFAPVLNYSMGEHFARAAFVDARVRHLFQQPQAPAPTPSLNLGEPSASSGETFDVAVALGARDSRRAFPHWNATLRKILACWPNAGPPLRFRLLGSANASAELATLSEAVRERSEDLVAGTTLTEAAHAVRDCAAFLGTDGGLMHIAAALGKPGLALFTQIDPSMRVAAGVPMRSLVGDPTMADLSADTVAAAFLAACDSR